MAPKSKARNVPDDSFDRYNRACRHGASCKFLAGAQCLFRHHGTQPHVELMTADLSSDPVALPAFGHVDTTVRWGIRRAETLAGFNSLEHGRLAVPGLPPTLHFPKSDISFKNRDENNAPSLPLTPKFDPLSRALRITRPDISLSDFDIVTTAGCLRRITSFLSYRPRPERLDVEVRNGTLFMGRWEGDPLLNKHNGYGSQFERRVTRHGTGLEGSASYHLVVGYELGGLKMGVQVEVDSFQCKCHWPPGLKLPKGAPGERGQAGENEKATGGTLAKEKLVSSGRFDVISSLDALSLNDPEDGILRTGTVLPLSCAVEIKTRKKNSTIDNPYIAQLYFQQTHRVFLAIHDGERFRREDMKFMDERPNLKNWEGMNQVLLGRLVALLGRVREEAGERVGGEKACKMALVLSIGEGERGRESWKASLYERDGEDMVSKV